MPKYVAEKERKKQAAIIKFPKTKVPGFGIRRRIPVLKNIYGILAFGHIFAVYRLAIDYGDDAMGTVYPTPPTKSTSAFLHDEAPLDWFRFDARTQQGKDIIDIVASLTKAALGELIQCKMFSIYLYWIDLMTIQ